MIRNICRVLALVTIALVTGQELCAQMNYLASWVPSSGASSFGPYTSPTGYMNMWQDGQCISGYQVNASVTEMWSCSSGATATVTGSAGLSWTYDDYICDSVPVGVFAHGSAQSPPGTTVNNEYGDHDCTGFRDSSGGPHPWPCGSGSAPSP